MILCDWSATLTQPLRRLMYSARYRYDRLPLIESSACSQDSVRWSEPKHVPRGTESVLTRLQRHGRAGHKFGGDREALSWQHQRSSPLLLTMCQTAFSVIPSPHVVPALLTLRNRLPRSIAAAANQSSSSFLTQSGTGTVRIWPPLPTKSTMAQCSSRC